MESALLQLSSILNTNPYTLYIDCLANSRHPVVTVNHRHSGLMAGNHGHSHRIRLQYNWIDY